MGEVIAFDTSARRAQRSAEPATGEAQILFFLGVRYMRMEEPHDPAPRRAAGGGAKPSGGKRKRRARA